MTRPSWDTHWMQIATLTAARSTCPRASVGCVLCIANRIVSTGYNGAIAGTAHCTDVGCNMHDGHCLRTVHAEANAIADAARRGVAVAGATAYVTHLPCINCAKLLVSAGVQRIVWDKTYDDGANIQFLSDAGVDLHCMGVTI
jgi:dCMP deaminase